MTERFRPFIVLFLISAISLLMFGRFIDNFFVYDDFSNLSVIAEGPVSLFRGCSYVLPRIVSNGLRWPLHYLFGNDPIGYNLFSVTVYICNGFLFYLLIKQLFNDSALAFITAVIFVCSAVGSDVVLWKSAYCGLTNFTFYLIALILYDKYKSLNNYKYYSLSVIVFILAVFSKEESASLPFVILAMELLIYKNTAIVDIIKRIIPYCIAIIFYLVLTYVLTKYVFNSASESSLYSDFNISHTLFAPWTVFFLAPNGILLMQERTVYVVGAALLSAIFFSSNRRYFVFAIVWIFVTFIPQSLASNPGSFEGKLIMHSISRYLYIPSAGMALVYGLTLTRFRDLVPYRHWVLIGFFILSGYFAFNYTRVKQRGEEWREKGIPMQTFLNVLKKNIPAFPPYSFVYAKRSTLPTERNFFEQALRSFYNNPTIFYIYNINEFVPLPDMSVYTINCLWNSPYEVNLEISSKKY